MEHRHIYHICTARSWEEQFESSMYTHESIELEGFIHCSKKDQIDGVLTRYFKGANDLLLLKIQSEKVNSNIRYEKGPNGEHFPHIFGRLNKDAIIEISKI